MLAVLPSPHHSVPFPRLASKSMLIPINFIEIDTHLRPLVPMENSRAACNKFLAK